MNGRSFFHRLRGAGVALVLAGVSCESGAERIARLEKEKAESLAEAMRAQAEAEGWQSFNLLVISIVAGVVVYLVATRVILQAPVAPGSVAAATAMAGMLSALRDADRLLNGEDLPSPLHGFSPLPSDSPPPARPAHNPEKMSARSQP